MNKLLVTLVATSFALGSASAFAADALKKKEELTSEQKTEIRDRAERMKTDRANADKAKNTPAAPAKKAESKRTSKATTATTPAAKNTMDMPGAPAK